MSFKPTSESAIRREHYELYRTEEKTGTLCATRYQYHAQNSKSASLNMLFSTETLRFLVSRHQVNKINTYESFSLVYEDKD